MLLDRSDSNAPNQVMLFFKTVFSKKQEYLDEVKDSTFKDSITIDSPNLRCGLMASGRHKAAVGISGIPKRAAKANTAGQD